MNISVKDNDYRWLCIGGLLSLSCVFIGQSLASSVLPNQPKNMAYYFAENNGQFSTTIKFVVHHPHYTALLKTSGVELVLRELSAAPGQHGTDVSSATIDTSVIRWTHVDGNEAIWVEGQQGVDAKSHYYRGGQKKHWIRNVNHYERVVYHSLYPGIDVVYYFNEGQLEFDYILAPFANPEQIKFHISGAEKLVLAEDGALHLTTALGPLVQRVPSIYQHIDGQRHSVTGGYHSLGEHTFGFQLGVYHRHARLVIDPIVSFSTFLGGAGKDNASGVAQDAQGNVYVTGTTAVIATLTPGMRAPNVGEDFVTDNPSDAAFRAGNKHGINGCNLVYAGLGGETQLVADFDAFLSKFDPDGQLLYSIYWGGCGNEGARALSLDSAGNVYILGSTLSSDFPTSDSAFKRVLSQSDVPDILSIDMFVSKFDPEGNMLYSTFLGGAHEERGRDIKVDHQGRAYVLGNTQSPGLATPCDDSIGAEFDQPVILCDLKGGVDLLLARLSPSGQAVAMATYVGGRQDDFAIGLDIEFDKPEDGQVIGVYIAGITQSADLLWIGQDFQQLQLLRQLQQDPVSVLPELIAVQKQLQISGETVSEAIASIAKKNPSLRQYRTATDGCGLVINVEKSGLCQDAFLIKLTDDFRTLAFRTFWGGDQDDQASGIALDSSVATGASHSGVYLTGTTYSRGFSHATITSLDEIPDDPVNQIVMSRIPLLDGVVDQLADSVSVEVFVTKFSRDGQRVIMSSFLRGSARDTVTAIVVNQIDKSELDSQHPAGSPHFIDEVYVAGHTESHNFPIVDGFQNINLNGDVFLTKLIYDPLGVRNVDARSDQRDDQGNLLVAGTADEERRLWIQFSTLLGGEDADFLFALDYERQQGTIALAGGTWSRNFFTTLQGHQLQYGGGQSDVFVTKLADIGQTLTAVHHECNNDAVDLFTEIITVSTQRNLFPGTNIRFLVNIENISANVIPNARIAISVPLASTITLATKDRDRCGIEDSGLVLYCAIEAFESKQDNIEFALSNPFKGRHTVRVGTISPCADAKKTNRVRDKNNILHYPPRFVENGVSHSFVLVERPNRGTIGLWSLLVMSLWLILMRYWALRNL